MSSLWVTVIPRGQHKAWLTEPLTNPFSEESDFK